LSCATAQRSAPYGRSSFALAERPACYVDERSPEVSVAVLDRMRGQGVGSALLRALIEEARARGVGLCLNVRDGNPALRLYERMGFMRIPGAEIRNRTGGLSIAMALP
jgi:GNAT superfamily N-acetyltransferase